MLKGELFDNKDSDNPLNRKVLNLTAAASIWFSGAIGMAIGFNFHFIAIISIVFVVIVTRISQVRKRREKAVE
ncbi:MgtC/SapB family protein [Candidatus Nitrosocosmicus sp. T]